MAFDPYASWLGISADDRPPTYYDLLGLPSFESDPKTIDQASVRRMGKVRQHQIGPHSELSQEILAELARARVVLMDPDRRVEYDAKLRAARGVRRDSAARSAKSSMSVRRRRDRARRRRSRRFRPAQGSGLNPTRRPREARRRSPTSRHVIACTPRPQPASRPLPPRATVEHQSEAPSSLRSTERISPPLWKTSFSALRCSCRPVSPQSGCSSTMVETSRIGSAP